jgi:hypothetical protein
MITFSTALSSDQEQGNGLVMHQTSHHNHWGTPSSTRTVVRPACDDDSTTGSVSIGLFWMDLKLHGFGLDWIGPRE